MISLMFKSWKLEDMGHRATDVQEVDEESRLAVAVVVDKIRKVGRRVSKLKYESSFSKYSAKTLSHLGSEVFYLSYGIRQPQRPPSSSSIIPESLLEAITDTSFATRHGF